MSCIVRALVKAVALPVKLTAKVLGKVSRAAAKAGARAGKSCGKFGAKACKKCQRNSARTCKALGRRSQKACRKLARNANSKRCARKCPKCCAPLQRCSHTATGKKCSNLCTKCVVKRFKCNASFKKPNCLRQIGLRTQTCRNRDRHRARHGHSPRLRDGNGRQKLDSSNRKKGSEGRATKPVGHSYPPLHRSADEGSNDQQGKTRRKRRTSPRTTKRPQPRSSASESASCKSVMEVQHSGMKHEHHKEVTRHRKGMSQERKGGESRTCVAANTAKILVNKKMSAVSQEKHADGPEKQSMAKLESKGEKPKPGSQAFAEILTKEMHATREDPQTRGENEADITRPHKTKWQKKNPNANLPSHRSKGREPAHSNEDARHVSGFNSAQGIKHKEHQNAKLHEQPEKRPKKKPGAVVQEYALSEAHLLHGQASLQDKHLAKGTRGQDKEYGEELFGVARGERSSEEKNRKDPAGMPKVAQEMECSIKDGSSKQRTARWQEKRESEDGKPPTRMDATKCMDSPPAEVTEESQKNRSHTQSFDAGKNIVGRRTAEARRAEVSKSSRKHLQCEKPTSNQLPGTDGELEKDAVFVQCNSATRLPAAARATDPISSSDKKTKCQQIVNERLAEIRSAEQSFTFGCQNCDSDFCEDKQLTDQTTLFGIECRLLPESACSAEWKRFA